MKLSRANKEMLTRALALNALLVKQADASTYDRMKYTSDAMKAGKPVTRTDLVDLLKDVIDLLGDKFIDPAMAEEMKPETKVETPAPAPAPKAEVKKPAPKKESSLKKTTKKEAPTTEALKEVAKDLEKSQKGAPKKTTKAKADSKPAEKTAPTGKKAPAKDEGKKSPAKKLTGALKAITETTKSGVVEMAELFPDTIEIEGETYALAKDLKTMQDVHRAFNNDEDIVFAFYWTKRHLRQFSYAMGKLPHPKEFKYNLDLASLIYVSDEFKAAYVVSMYTEAAYDLIANEILEDEDGFRYCNNIEYQIYRKK